MRSKEMMTFHRPIQAIVRSAFTLVELLVAVTASLLLMAALAKSFAIIGQSTQEGRSQVRLSAKMRGISFRLRNDLRSRSIDANPPAQTKSGRGYFMYYEGPLTEHTFGLFGAEPTRTNDAGDVLRPSDPRYSDPEEKKGPTYRRLSRYGDSDDYIAFTAEASGDEWFTGKVPAYLVDDEATDPMEPRVIRSKFAEIIIWASPRWQVDPVSNSLKLAPNPTAMPRYVDENNDLAPDDIVLHQRILLIRPDLNARREIPNKNRNLEFTTNVLRPYLNDLDPARVPPALQAIYPIGTVLYPDYAASASGGASPNNQALFVSNWLVGMTPIHHFFDLSLHRIIHPDTGEPTSYVAANSLQDLVQPHNRFAHVRYPGRYMGMGSFSSSDSSADNLTSMPLLAVGWNDTILNWQGDTDPRAPTSGPTPPTWFPTSHPSPRTGNNSSGLFNGWLLPHFELGDPNQPGSSGSSHWERGYIHANVAGDPRWDRTGEDIIATGILSFDVKGFDSTAPVFLTSGPDGAPGAFGVDDDASGNEDVTEDTGKGPASELGSVGTDDVVVTANDLGIYHVVREPILDPKRASTYNVNQQALGSRGGFVDLLYPYLAGGPLQEQTMVALGGPGQVRENYDDFLQSELSLFPVPISALNSLKRSGKFVHRDPGGRIWFMQPTYDTWTDYYEFDNFAQSDNLAGDLSPPFQNGTVWFLNNVSGLNRVPRTLTSGNVLQIDTGRLKPGEPETSAPFATRLPAISISVRLSEPSTDSLMDFTIVEELQ